MKLSANCLHVSVSVCAFFIVVETGLHRDDSVITRMKGAPVSQWHLTIDSTTVC